MKREEEGKEIGRGRGERDGAREGEGREISILGCTARVRHA